MSGTQVTAPTRAEFKSLRECQTLGQAFNCSEFLERIKQSVPTHVKPQRMLRTFVQATSRQSLLLQCNMRSVLGAMLTCSELGVEPNTPLGHAYLIPFGKYEWDKVKKERVPVLNKNGEHLHDLQLILGYPGLLDLAYRSGHVISVHADVVWPQDARDRDRWRFNYGTNAELYHVPSGRHEDNEVPVWAYAHASITGGQGFRVMPWADVLRIRNSSQGFVAALRAKENAERKGWRIPATWTEAPWVKHEIAMAQKTAFRQAAKWIPKSIELAGAVALDEQQDAGMADFGQVIDGKASVLEGGLPEGEPADVDDPIDPGSAFNLRTETREEPEQQQKPAPEPVATRQQRQPPQEAAKATPPPAATKPPAEKPTPPAPVQAPANSGFSEWLVDADGTPIEQQGESAKFTDPVAYMQAVTDYLRDCFPADRPGIERANSDAMDAALLADAGAQAIYDAYRNPPAKELDPQTIDQGQPEPNGGIEADIPEDPGSPETAGRELFDRDPLEILTPTREVKAEWEVYAAKAKLALASCTSPSMIDHFTTVNSPAFLKFPPKYRIEVLTLIDTRRKEIAPPPPKDQPATSEVEDIKKSLTLAADACKTKAELVALDGKSATRKAVARLQALDPDECAKMQQAFRDRHASLP